MYNINNDIRTKKSAELIYQGLLQCLKTKHISEVTVTDIYHASSVSRSTFYHLFDNTIDVFHYKCDLFTDEINTYIAEHPTCTMKELFIGIYEIHQKYRVLLELLIKQNLLHLLLILKKHFSTTLKKFLENKYALTQTQQEYYFTTLSTSILSTFITWVKRGCQETPNELYEYAMSYNEFLKEIMNEN